MAMADQWYLILDIGHGITGLVVDETQGIIAVPYHSAESALLAGHHVRIGVADDTAIKPDRSPITIKGSVVHDDPR